MRFSIIFRFRAVKKLGDTWKKKNTVVQALHAFNGRTLTRHTPVRGRFSVHLPATPAKGWKDRLSTNSTYRGPSWLPQAVPRQFFCYFSRCSRGRCEERRELLWTYANWHVKSRDLPCRGRGVGDASVEGEWRSGNSRWVGQQWLLPSV